MTKKRKKKEQERLVPGLIKNNVHNFFMITNARLSVCISRCLISQQFHLLFCFVIFIYIPYAYCRGCYLKLDSFYTTTTTKTRWKLSVVCSFMDDPNIILTIECNCIPCYCLRCSLDNGMRVM